MSKSATEATQTSFRLLDVPVELRAKIFAHLFQNDDPMRIKVICRTQKKNREPYCELARRDHERVRDHRSETYDEIKEEWVPNLDITSAVLINRQLNADATQVLYGCNGFSFESPAVLCEFLHAIGDKRTYLKHLIIETGGYMRVKSQEACNMLVSAKSLRKLEVPHLDVCGTHGLVMASANLPKPYPPAGIVSRAKNLLKALHESHKASARSYDVGDILQITPMPECGSISWEDGSIVFSYPHSNAADHRRVVGVRVPWRGFNCNCLCRDVDRVHAKMMDVIRKEVAKVLEED